MNFRLADDSVAYAEEEEADGIVNSIDTTCTKYMIEIGLAKTKIIINNPDGFRRENKSNRKAMNRNWSNQKANPALKTKTGNK